MRRRKKRDENRGKREIGVIWEMRGEERKGEVSILCFMSFVLLVA